MLLLPSITISARINTFENSAKNDMKFKLIFILIFLVTGFSARTQEMNKTMIDARFNREILIGFCDRMGLEKGDHGEIFKLEYEDYVPDKNVIKKLMKLKNDFSIVLVMGAWCPDCQDLVPQFYKILDESEIGDESLRVIAVDGYKKCEGVGLEKYKIEKVPTFIFYRKGKEIGRIIERPKGKLEEDILGIVQ